MQYTKPVVQYKIFESLVELSMVEQSMLLMTMITGYRCQSKFSVVERLAQTDSAAGLESVKLESIAQHLACVVYVCLALQQKAYHLQVAVLSCCK
jgi:hypothetical protein